MVVRAKPSSMWTSMWYCRSDSLISCPLRIEGDEFAAGVLAGRDHRRLGGGHQVARPVERVRGARSARNCRLPGSDLLPGGDLQFPSPFGRGVGGEGLDGDFALRDD